jgi:predicted MFS family arabinose efflux permease
VLFGRTTLGSLPDRRGPRPSLLAGYACLTIGLAAIALSGNPIIDLLAAMLVGFGYSLPWPALASVVVSQVRPSERAAALAALNAFYDLFVAASSAIAGAAAEHWGLSAPFWLAIGSVTLAASLVFATGMGTGHRRAAEDLMTQAA